MIRNNHVTNRQNHRDQHRHPEWRKIELAGPTSADVNVSINALITMLKNPKVNNVIGSEIICKTGRTLAFKIAKTRLAANAIQMLET